MHLHRLCVDLAAGWRFALVFAHLEPFDPFEDFDAMQANFNAKIILQVHLSNVFNNLTVHADLL